MKKVVAKKSLGQNFLKDESVIEQIFSVALVGPKDWVFEVGPGTGALTHKLVGRVEKYVALEVDHDLAIGLQRQFTDSKKVTIVEGNVLDIYLEKMLQDVSYTEHPYKIIANIPYYITAPIIRTLLGLSSQPESMTLMVQDEVAERLSAKPGSMSLLSLMVQYYAEVEKKFFVPKEAFDPVPKVDSAVIYIVPKRPYDKEADRAVFRIARAGFSARRKTLANNLSTSFSIPREAVVEQLQAIGLSSDVRAQALSVDNWEQLARMWPKNDA
ncbi:MAG: ribosomal RNA small subunit methyltransferase A [Candidatus Moranbacteria bacterium]|nr:ribosomal RNA small subunit methyltransferase A [Candidatus Moranbacteria bacterium]